MLLGTSLADRNEMGSQTTIPIRPRELRISQLKCNSNWEASDGGLAVARQPPGAGASLGSTSPKVLRKAFYQRCLPKFKDTLYYFEKVLEREKTLLT